MKPVHRFEPRTGHWVLDYTHPQTREYIRHVLQQMSDGEHMPHDSVYREEHPPDLPKYLETLKNGLGFGSKVEMAEWAGLKKAIRVNVNWAARAEEVGRWVETARERHLAEQHDAEAEYGYGLKAAGSATVQAYRPRSGRWHTVEAILLR